MIDYGVTYGATAPAEAEYKGDKVFVATDIEEVETDGEIQYKYNLTEYTLDEYNGTATPKMETLKAAVVNTALLGGLKTVNLATTGGNNMSAITWTRNEFTCIADATERQAWYEGIGLGDWFDITMGTGGTNADVFTIQPYTDGARLELNFTYMDARVSSNWEQMSNIAFYLAGTSATTAYSGTTKPKASSTAGKLSFDFATVGNVELLRMCTTENSWDNEVILARDTTTTADGETAKLVAMNNSYGNNANYPRAGGYIILADTTGSTKYNSNTGSGAAVQYRSNSVTYCDKYILQPIQTLGIISHIYAIDGSPNYAPVGDVEFVLGSHVYYSLGHGMCVRVK